MTRWPGNAKAQLTPFGGLSRSRLMSRIRSSRNATTELKLISLLRSAGLKGWRRNYPLPGKPDFVFSEKRLALFVDGCFWHAHDCGRNLTPKRNAPYWLEKFVRNRRRDVKITRTLRRKGWSVLRIWECRLTRHPTVCLTRIAIALKHASKNTAEELYCNPP